MRSNRPVSFAPIGQPLALGTSSGVRGIFVPIFTFIYGYAHIDTNQYIVFIAQKYQYIDVLNKYGHNKKQANIVQATIQ